MTARRLLPVLLAAMLPATAWAQAGENPSFRLINRGQSAIVEVFATPSGHGNWGQNRLDKDTLEPKAERVFKIPTTGDCYFDLKVVFADKKVREKKHTNLCKVANLPVE